MTRHLKIIFFLGALITAVAGSWDISQAQRRPFSHTTPQHKQGKYKDCASCHTLPTKGWASFRRQDKEKPFPDIRTYPGHNSCFGCHTRDIYTAGGAFCGNCHTVPTMRARAVKSFPNRAHARQFDIIFPHDIHQDLIAQQNVPRSYAPAHFVNASFVVDDKPKPTFYNCAICHQTAAAMPKFVPRKVGGRPLMTPSVDAFVRPVSAEFFKDSPDSHASCFQCHYRFQNLPAGKQDCSACHAPAKPYFEKRTLERYSIKFDHNRTGHGEKDCASCHVRITQNPDARLMKDADVPVASCRSCHATQEDEPSRKILRTEVEARIASIADKKPVFQCTYCHTSSIGSLEIPLSHSKP